MQPDLANSAIVGKLPRKVADDFQPIGRNCGNDFLRGVMRLPKGRQVREARFTSMDADTIATIALTDVDNWNYKAVEPTTPTIVSAEPAVRFQRATEIQKEHAIVDEHADVTNCDSIRMIGMREQLQRHDGRHNILLLVVALK
jgi:hypothetical protein